MCPEKKFSYRSCIIALVLLVLLINCGRTSGKSVKASARSQNKFQLEDGVDEKGHSLLDVVDENNKTAKKKSNRKSSVLRKHSSTSDIEDISFDEPFDTEDVKNKIHNELVEPLIKAGELKKVGSKELSSQENLEEKHLKSKRQELLNLLDSIIKKKNELERKLNMESKNKVVGEIEDQDGEEEDSDENSNNNSEDASNQNENEGDKTELSKDLILDVSQKYSKDGSSKSELSHKNLKEKRGYLNKREDKESGRIPTDHDLDPLNKEESSPVKQKYLRNSLQKDNSKRFNADKKEKFNKTQKTSKAMEDELMELYDSETNKKVLKKDLSRHNPEMETENDEENYYRPPPRQYPFRSSRYGNRAGSRHRRRWRRDDYEDDSGEEDLPQVSNRRYKRQGKVVKPASIKFVNMYQKRGRNMNSNYIMRRNREPRSYSKIQYVDEIYPIKSDQYLPYSEEEGSSEVKLYEKDIFGERSYNNEHDNLDPYPDRGESSYEEVFHSGRQRFHGDEMPHKSDSRYHCKRSISFVPLNTGNNTKESTNSTNSKIVQSVNVTKDDIHNITKPSNFTKIPEKLELKNSTDFLRNSTDFEKNSVVLQESTTDLQRNATENHRKYREAFLLVKQSHKIVDLLRNLENDKSVLNSDSEQSIDSSDSHQINSSTNEDLSIQNDNIGNSDSEDISHNHIKYLKILKKKEKEIKSLLRRGKSKRDTRPKLNSDIENKHSKSKKFSRYSDPLMKHYKKNPKNFKTLKKTEDYDNKR